MDAGFDDVGYAYFAYELERQHQDEITKKEIMKQVKQLTQSLDRLNFKPSLADRKLQQSLCEYLHVNSNNDFRRIGYRKKH